MMVSGDAKKMVEDMVKAVQQCPFWRLAQHPEGAASAPGFAAGQRFRSFQWGPPLAPK